MAKVNRVERISLSGGIIGSMLTNPRNAIEKKCRALNAEGWNCHQIISHSSNNILVAILRVVVLVCTLFMWTFGDGYILLFEKEQSTLPNCPEKKETKTNDSKIKQTEYRGENDISNDNNWICGKCGAINEIYLLHCKKCNKEFTG